MEPFALCVSIAAAMLAGRGGSQPAIGSPGVPQGPGRPAIRSALALFLNLAIATRRSSTTAFHTDLQHTRVGFLAAVDLLVDP